MSMSGNPEFTSPSGNFRQTEQTVLGGSIVEALAAAGTLILAILGLANVSPMYMAEIGVIAFGVALTFQGGAVAGRFSNLLTRTRSEGDAERAMLGGGMTASLIGGLAGIVLGVLALLNIRWLTLVEVAVIVFGAALLLSSGVTSRLAYLEHSRFGTNERYRELTQDATLAASGAQVLVGLGAVVLGILAIVGYDPLTLVLVALLALSAGALLSAVSIGGHIATSLWR